MSTDADPMTGFSAPTRAWFASAFVAPTPAQVGAWQAITSGNHAVVVAPTGSGKTLAAFLWSIDSLLTEPVPTDPAHRCRVLYVSPLKALAADVERNLAVPLAGIRAVGARSDLRLAPVRIGVRTGDTPASERRAFGRKPPDVLITTPESLFLILTSAARSGLAGVRTVIIDEIHAVAGTKRGAHLAVSLERLDELLEAPAQRIGLSATVRPPETVARFLTGARADELAREVVIVQPPSTKRIEVEVVVPVPDLANLSAAPRAGTPRSRAPGSDGDPEATPRDRGSIWPHVEERVVELVAAHRSTLVFTNSRRSAERLTARMNEVWAARSGFEVAEPGSLQAAATPGQSGVAAGIGDGHPAGVLARAHHGSMSRAQRTATETELKDGLLPAVVATSSLELGIDMGALDLVIQVGAPPSVASGLQRAGRAGHQVGAVSRTVMFPTHRGDLIASAVSALRMRTGQIERQAELTNPVDVLAQQIVAMLAMGEMTVGHLGAVVRRAAPFATLGEATLHAVLDMLAGRYPSEQFAELRPRIVWDRRTDLLTARPGAQRLAVTSGGTIPDRGLYTVVVAGPDRGSSNGEASASAGATDAPARSRGGRRVGELDEEMVYESRVGDTFTLGSSTWRIEEITHDRVVVSPAPGVPGRLPFWKGDTPGRPAELGRALGAWVRELDLADARETVRDAPVPPRSRSAESDRAGDGAGSSVALLVAAAGLDDWAADNVLAYLREQRAATGRVPDDRTIVVERFRDELGDWRVVVHSPFGARVHAPWGLVIAARLRERYGVDVSVLAADDGIVLRLPDMDSPDDGEPALDPADLLIDPREVASAVRERIGGSALFAARFREAAARALLLPRRRPDRRQPLWQQRQRSAQLLAVASAHADFPILLEATRECLRDDYDVEALTELMGELAARRIEIVDVATPFPSPFARSLLFGYTVQFLYDGDTPLAERRAAALTLDPLLLAELLGGEQAGALADLLDPAAVERTEAELARRTPERQARDLEGLADLLRTHGPLTADEATPAVRPDRVPEIGGWLRELERSGRAVAVHLPGTDAEARWAVVEDAARLRDGLGAVPLAPGDDAATGATGDWSALPGALTTPVADPLGDLVSRHARTHGPFTAVEAADRLGLPLAVVDEVLSRLAATGGLARGRLRPDSLRTVSSAEDFCDADVLRTLRRRSLAALRAEIEPVDAAALGRFLPAWQGVGHLRGVDGLARAIDTLAGAVLPVGALETLILPARVQDYSPSWLDELCSAGEVIWRGHGVLPGGDALISLHPAATAHLTLAPALLAGPAARRESGATAPGADDAEGCGTADERSSLPTAVVLEALRSGGASFAGTLLGRLDGAAAPDAVIEALWELVWAGLVTNDSFAPVRARLHGSVRRPSRTAPRVRPLTARAFATGRAYGSGPGGAVATGGHHGRGAAAGRWTLVPEPEAEPTARLHALAVQLLERHGVLTRAVAPSEGVSGQFGSLYRVLTAMEHSGRVRRGYFVEHLGGSQFALPGAVDALRAPVGAAPAALVLAASDPASPYGAALAWPDSIADADPQPAGTGPGSGRHRPGRKAGAVVVLVDGALVLYLERGGRSLLSFCTDEDALGEAALALAELARRGQLGRLTVERANGEVMTGRAARTGTLGTALVAAGFLPTPRGLQVRGSY